MDLSEIQDIHFNWLDSVGWVDQNTPLESLMLIVSECGEAADELREEPPTGNLPLELADIVLRTMGLASELGIDLENAILRKIDINKARGTKGRVR